MGESFTHDDRPMSGGAGTGGAPRHFDRSHTLPLQEQSEGYSRYKAFPQGDSGQNVRHNSQLTETTKRPEQT